MKSTTAIPHRRFAPLHTQRSKRLLFIWGALTPILVYFSVFSLLPIVGALYISLHHWPLVGGAPTFIGLENYIDIARDGRFWNSVGNTAYFASAYVVLVLVLGLGLALLLEPLRPWVQSLLRPIYFAPQIMSAVAVGLVFTWLYQPQFGVLNYLLSFVGLGPFLWLQSSAQVMPAIILAAVWQSVGYSMLIYISGLISISPDLYDAASIDGATSRQTFWYITLPLLRPTTLFLFVTSMIGGFQVFTQVWLMSKGGPGTASRVIVLEIYEQGFKFFEMGRSSALAFYLLALIAGIAALQLRYFRDQVEH